MLDITETENYIKIIEDDAEIDSIKFKLSNAYPNSEHSEFDFMVIDFDITTYDENSDVVDYYSYNISEFEEYDCEEEFHAIVDKIYKFIKTNPFKNSTIKVRMLLKKSLDKPITL